MNVSSMWKLLLLLLLEFCYIGYIEIFFKNAINKY